MRITGDRCEEPADECAPADEVFGYGRAEPLPVQRAADPVGEVSNQLAAAVHVGARQLHGSAVADRGVEVGERVVEGVVRAGPRQHRITGEPHAPAAGVCGGAAEQVAGLHDHDR